VRARTQFLNKSITNFRLNCRKSCPAKTGQAGLAPMPMNIRSTGRQIRSIRTEMKWWQYVDVVYCAPFCNKLCWSVASKWTV